VTRHTKVEEAEQKAAQEISRLQELAYELQVEQAMTREVITVSPRSTMAEFGQVLRANRVSGTPVVEAGRMIGIISIEDLVKALAAGEPDATVGKKMTPIPVTLRADEPLVHAVSKFSKLQFGRFPVVNQEGDLVGIITPGNIVQAMLKRLEVDYREEDIHRYRASHIFEDIIADDIALVFGYRVLAGDIGCAGEASSGLRRTLSRLGIHPQVIRRVAVATYEAEMNVVIFTDGGEIVAEVRPTVPRSRYWTKALESRTLSRLCNRASLLPPPGYRKWVSAQEWACPTSTLAPMR